MYIYKIDKEYYERKYHTKLQVNIPKSLQQDYIFSLLVSALNSSKPLIEESDLRMRTSRKIDKSAILILVSS